jgi:hypothetical protein
LAHPPATGYTAPQMFDRLYLPFLGLAAAAAIALALVWPQGDGARSWGPFGRTPEQQRPEVQAAMQRENEAAERRAKQTRDALRALQTQAIAPGQ